MAESKSKADDRNAVGQAWYFRGKYAEYMNDLYGKGAAHPIFDTIYRGYAFCCLYGLVKGERRVYNPSTDNPNDIAPVGFRWTSADSSGVYSYETLRKIVLIYGGNGNKSFEEKMDSALRFDFPTNDVKDERLREKSRYADYSSLVDEYALGGLEAIHDKVMSTTSDQSLVYLFDTIIKDLTESRDKKRQQRVV